MASRFQNELNSPIGMPIVNLNRDKLFDALGEEFSTWAWFLNAMSSSPFLVHCS